MITSAVRKEVELRSRGHCENPECFIALMGNFETHHIYWRSQYRKSDRDDVWNLANLCVACHYSIHSQANIKLDTYLKRSADIRKPTNQRSSTISKDILNQRKARKTSYRSKIEAYKASHNDLSPSQVQYRQRKQYYANLERPTRT